MTDRLLLSYRAPAACLAPLIPAPFTLDVHRGHGLLSVCALEVRDMGLSCLPDSFRFHNLEILYRVGVRLRGQSTFLTLRSDTSSRVLSVLGGAFSHYRLNRANVTLERTSSRLVFRALGPGGDADAVVDVDTRAARPHSLFDDSASADRFLLGMRFSADPGNGRRLLIQPIEHTPWDARFVQLNRARFRFLERFSQSHGVPLEYDNTLHMQGVCQTWHRASYLP